MKLLLIIAVILILSKLRVTREQYTIYANPGGPSDINEIPNYKKV